MKGIIRVVFVLMILSLTAGFAIAQDAKLNVNSATQEQLAAIPEIGPELAGKIIEYRSEMGDIYALDELLDVEGMDQGKLDSLKEKLTIDAIEGSDCTC